MVRPTAGRGNNGRLEAYGIKRLRELVLELAVRGKLLVQDSNDEPAAELLKRAQSEKAKLIKNGKIKKNKDFPDIAEDEIPFDCPFGWQWARINDVGHDLGQKTPDSKFTYIDVSAIDNSRGVIDTPTVLSASEAPSRARKIVKKGTVIYSTVRPYLKNICVLDQYYSPEPIASTAFAVLYPFQEMPGRFFAMYFRSPEFVRYVERVQTGIAYPAINDKQFYGGLVPIPPLAEQHRIVAKVDELMALCDQLEQQQGRGIEAHQTLVETLLGALTNVESAQEFAAAWDRIAEHFDTLFTTEYSIDQLNQTILQLAVMGKLVPQDPTEGAVSALLDDVAKERGRLIKAGVLTGKKVLPAVQNIATANSLPVGWQWVNLGDLVSVMDAGWSPACSPEPSPNDKTWGVLKTTAVQVMQYLQEENKVLPLGKKPRPQYEVKAGDILITRAGPKNRVGISCLVQSTRPRLMISDKIIRFHLVNTGIYERYIALCLNAGHTAEYLEASKSGMAESQMNISQDKLRLAPIPLCPINEQHRIVAKFDELMALCDALKARLAEAQTTQIRLADAIVERALAVPEAAAA